MKTTILWLLLFYSEHRKLSRLRLDTYRKSSIILNPNKEDVYARGFSKTAFKTKYGHFKFLETKMGLRNAPATFQSFLHSIPCGCDDDLFVIYLDDILIFSDDREDHQWHFCLVLSMLKENEIHVERKKYEFLKEETEFLGLILGKAGFKISEDRMKLVGDWPILKLLAELRGFIGLVELFRRFIRGFSGIAAYLRLWHVRISQFLNGIMIVTRLLIHWRRFWFQPLSW